MHFQSLSGLYNLDEGWHQVALNIWAAFHDVALWSCLGPCTTPPLLTHWLYLAFWQKKGLAIFHQDLTTGQKAMEMPRMAKDKDTAGLDSLGSIASTTRNSLFLSHRAHSSPIPMGFTGFCFFTLLPHRIPLASERFKSQRRTAITWLHITKMSSLKTGYLSDGICEMQKIKTTKCLKSKSNSKHVLSESTVTFNINHHNHITF